ncbi:MAG: cobalamin-dependent protein [Thermoproteota archaeon]|nr:cobalamin-dependent protein [Thermoproteota archaeon]
MVYIRTKTVKGIDYLYLVKSIWDANRKTSRQETVKYLGEASTVTKDDIPNEFQNNPKINSYLIKKLPANSKKRIELEKKIQEKFFNALISGNKNSASNVFEQFTTTHELGQFYRKIFVPSMTKIGDLWEEKKLGVAAEHIASNVAQNLIKNITETNTNNGKNGKVLLTTPQGENHSIGCDVLESFLQNKGFTVFNLAPSTPAKYLVEFMKTSKPNSIVISVTLEENLRSANRLINKIREKSKKIPIFIGGQALESSTRIKFDAKVVEKFSDFNTIIKLLKIK